jgi:hypothetical protein
MLIDGALVVDHEYIHPERSIAVQLVSTVRYGREDDEVMGLNLSKEICLANVIVNKAAPPEHLTQMQARDSQLTLYYIRLYSIVFSMYYFLFQSHIIKLFTIFFRYYYFCRFYIYFNFIVF